MSSKEKPLTILLRSFMAPAKMQTREDISRTIHQAMVEILTLEEAGLPMKIAVNFESTVKKDYTKDVSFRQAEGGTITPVFLQEQLRQAILGSLTADAVEDDGDNGGFTEPSLDDSQKLITERALEFEQENKDESAQGQMESQVQSPQLAKRKIVHVPEEIEGPFHESTPNDESWMHVQFNNINTKFAVSESHSGSLRK